MSPLPPQARWRSLLEAAIHAPSPHNVQPWRIRIVDEDECLLCIEKARTLPKEDVEGSFIVLTMGLFVDALRLAAAYQGLAVDDTLAHEPAWYSAANLESRPEPVLPFATLRLRADAAARPAFPLELLKQRRTSRLSYGAEPMAQADVAALARLAEEFGARFVVCEDAARIERLLAWNIEAVFEDLNHTPYRDELRGWVRYTEAQSRRQRDGLDARCMNQAPLEMWLAFHASRMLRWPIAGKWFARRYRAQIGPVATLGFLCGPFWNPADAYADGRTLLRFWLECTRRGYSIHPYGNLVTRREVAARVERETGLADVWLAFKIGRSAEAPASRRRSLEEVLIA